MTILQFLAGLVALFGSIFAFVYFTVIVDLRADKIEAMHRRVTVRMGERGISAVFVDDKEIMTFEPWQEPAELGIRLNLLGIGEPTVYAIPRKQCPTP